MIMKKKFFYRAFSWITLVVLAFSIFNLGWKILTVKEAAAVQEKTTVTLVIHPRKNPYPPKAKRVVFFPERLLLKQIWEGISLKISSIVSLF
jgi:hypothetical protein